jgi:hypothetical protein
VIFDIRSKDSHIKEVELVHQHQQELHRHDEHRQDALLSLSQLSAQSALAHEYPRMPLIRKIVELTKAIISMMVWIHQALMKQKAVTGRKLVRL